MASVLKCPDLFLSSLSLDLTKLESKKYLSLSHREQVRNAVPKMVGAVLRYSHHLSATLAELRPDGSVERGVPGSNNLSSLTCPLSDLSSLW